MRPLQYRPLPLRLRQHDPPTPTVTCLALVWRIVYPDGWLPWAPAGVSVLLTLAGALPGGDMKGLVALALFDEEIRKYEP